MPEYKEENYEDSARLREASADYLKGGNDILGAKRESKSMRNGRTEVFKMRGGRKWTIVSGGKGKRNLVL